MFYVQTLLIRVQQLTYTWNLLTNPGNSARIRSGSNDAERAKTQLPRIYGSKRRQYEEILNTSSLTDETCRWYVGNKEILMHFWIDKRSQAYGFNGRHGVPASLATGRRRNKPMVTPVHRFQSIENGPIQHVRRYHSSSHARHTNQQPCLTSTISNPAVNGTIMANSLPSSEVDNSIYIETPADGNMDTGQHSQLMRLGGLIKYGMWASFGLITVSVAVTKFFINHQGTFEMLLLCTLGMLSVGLLGSCILSACRTKTTHEFITVPPQRHRTAEIEIQEIISHVEETILPVEVPASTPNQTIAGSNSNAAAQQEQPPPPYHIAILLPPKERHCEELPPPSYEHAVR